MIEMIGSVLLILGVISIVIGAVCILFFSEFYSRLLACSYIDTIGMILISVGLIILSPNATHSFKILLVLIFFLAINPISTHAIGRSAYLRGERPLKKEE